MAESSSYSDYYDDYSYTSSTTSSSYVSPMWEQILRMPFDQLEETSDFVYIEKVLSLVTDYRFSESDSRMSDPQYTIAVARLLTLISRKCSRRIKDLSDQNEKLKAETRLSEQVLRGKLDVQSKEILHLKNALDEALKITGDEDADTRKQLLRENHEIKTLKQQNDTLAVELRRVSRANDDLTQTLKTREVDHQSLTSMHEKMQLEYRHLVSRYSKLRERSNRSESTLSDVKAKEKSRRIAMDSEFERFKQRVEELEKENASLVKSRDRAEDICERRETEALRDMNQLKHLTEQIIRDEKEKLLQKEKAFTLYREDTEAHIEKLLTQHDEEMRLKEEEITLLNRQIEKNVAERKRRFEDSSSSDNITSAQGDAILGDKLQVLELGGANQRAVSELRRLERENDDLLAQVEQLEMNMEAIEEENKKLNRLVMDYEHGNDGLRRLRRELDDGNRTVERLQSENAQLRERLNSTEDSLTFTAALQELCLRMGVTADEINSLRPQNAAAFSEMDTLKEEVNILKEEVEWLEKERRHWMNKVRLQPLMDTKLRFELGLSSEQLRQLDNLVNQMREGRVVVEDAERDYKEKYFRELDARRQDAHQFNEYVKHRIDDALQNAFNGTEAQDAVAAISRLKEHMEVIITGPSLAQGTKPDVDPTQANEKIESLQRRLEQSALTLKDNAATIATLRERVAATTAERDSIAKERDQYRDAIFDAAGLAASADEERSLSVLPRNADADEAADGGARTGTGGAPAGSVEAGIRLSNAKWATVSTTLREQLAAKDAIIASFGEQTKQLQEKMAAQEAAIVVAQEETAAQVRAHGATKDQVAALTELNEELTERNRELERVNRDLQDGLSGSDIGERRDLLQRIVLLRRREATLLQRLRRATTAQEDAAAADKAMRASAAATLASLKEALEGGPSAGLVLPPSTARHQSEQDALHHIHRCVDELLRGKAFYEDARYVAQMQMAYSSMDHSQELLDLRLVRREHQQRNEELQTLLDEQRVELESLRAAQSPSAAHPGEAEVERRLALACKWEAEATSWRQKYTLCTKRLSDKTTEVEMLEKDVDVLRQEVVDMRESLGSLLQGGGSATDSAPLPLVASEEAPDEGGADGSKHAATTGQGPPLTAHRRSTAAEVARAEALEREVARLKSINLGLLMHSLDSEAQVRSLEVELESRSQEVALTRSSAEAHVVSDFVSAAIREHAALRRQSELALVQVKRLRVQLAATEANYYVVANEASAYKLSAHRLYRKYVEEMVDLVHYLRSVQRGVKGALSPHRVELMDKRLHRVMQELHGSLSRNKSLAMRLEDQTSAVVTLEQQITLMKMNNEGDLNDVMDTRLREAKANVREHARQMTECREDCKHAQAKVARLEEHVRELNSELARVELGGVQAWSLDEQLVSRLAELKEAVLAQAERAVPALTSLPMNSGGAREDTDAAISEYKGAVMKHAESARECAELRRQLDQRTVEAAKTTAATVELRDEVARMEELVASVQRQLEEERQRATVREQRIHAAHEAQRGVAQRATEHSTRCLQDMLGKRDEAIKRLQGQLDTEKRRHIEHQLEEAVRMERVHEHLFKENTAMVERFKEAVAGAGNVLGAAQQMGAAVASISALGDGNAAVSEQLQALTSETMRLQSELKHARSTNILLESQLEQQVQLSQQALAQQQAHTAPSQVTTTAAPVATTVGATASTDALGGIIRSQSAMLDSLRQRELTLSEALQREKARGDELAKQLEAEQLRGVTQGGALDFVTRVTRTAESPVLVQEMRLQLAQLEQELRSTRALLEEERRAARTLQVDAEEWRTHLATLQSEVVARQGEVERAKHLASLNAGLQKDLDNVKGQNDKLVLAASVLRQKLMDEARRGGESSRQHQQEIALAQRMGSIQQESAECIKALELRVKTIQRELDGRVSKEEQMQATNAEAQRLIYNLHLQLREKEREVIEMKRARAAAVPPPSTSAAATTATPVLVHVDKGTQSTVSVAAFPASPPSAMATPHDLDVTQPGVQGGVGRREDGAATPPASTAATSKSATVAKVPTAATEWTVGREAAALPQVAGVISREVQRHQREQLQELSMLRSNVQRLEEAVTATQEQLRGERATTKVLRAQVMRLRKEQEETEVAHARELLQQRRRPPGPSSDAAPTGPAEAAELRRRVEELEQQLARVPAVFRASAPTVPPLPPPPSHSPIAAVSPPLPSVPAVPTTQATTPADARAEVHKAAHLEGTIDALRQRVEVEHPRRVAELEHASARLQRTLHRIAADYAQLKGLSLSQVLEIYDSPAVQAERTVEQLEAELLRRCNALLDAQFAKETAELQRGRAERHLQHILSADASASAGAGTRSDQLLQTQRNRIESLEAVVENLKVVIERLQRENASMSTRGSWVARQAALLREVRELRTRESALQEQVDRLSARLTSIGGRGSAMSDQQVQLQRKLASAQAAAGRHHSELESLCARLETGGPEPGAGQGGGARVVSWFVPRQRGVRPLTSDEEEGHPLQQGGAAGWGAAPSSPPPLPEAPLVQRSVAAAAAVPPGAPPTVESGNAGDAAVQRRLSTLYTQPQHPADFHASAHHHPPID